MANPRARHNLSDRSRAEARSRLLVLALTIGAIAYAFLAGYHTLTSFDLGWQLATGRWIALHHQVPSTDVFSYTAQGQPWIYPVGSGLLLYATYAAGGYALLSWLGALACTGTTVILLRRGSATTAAIAIIAVPMLAARANPRAEMFTLILFAVFFSILWQHLEGGKAKLWLLPLLMAAWVNLHLGFLSGLALLVAFTSIELLQMLQRQSRAEAARRLRIATPWLVATAFTTLVNPWGWGLYRALFRQEMMMGLHSQQITEWVNVPLTSAAFRRALSFRRPDGAVYLLLAIAIVAALGALFRRQLGVAVLLSVAAWFGVRHLRLEAFFACVLIVAGGATLDTAISALCGCILPDRKIRSIVAGGVATMLILLVVVRSADLITNRYYFGTAGERGAFGTGLSWWFPEKASEFIQGNKLPTRAFNSYNEGGYVVWRLGPSYQDYIDGRAIPFGADLFTQETRLMKADPDGPEWQQEADKYRIKTILVSLGRYDGLELFPRLSQFCASESWAPVYLDETSVIFLRRTPETRALIERTRLNCGTAPIPRFVSSIKGQAFNQWSNAAAVLYSLGRDQEAFAAATNSLSIFPGSSVSRLIRARVLVKMGRTKEAEDEFLAAADLEDNPAVWLSLARMYHIEGRLPAAIHAMQRGVELSAKPFPALVALGNLYLDAHDPKDALEALERARKALPAQPELTVSDKALADLAQSRALAWRALGDLNQAVSEQERAVQFAPDIPRAWLQLADLYALQGRTDDAEKARQQASLAKGQ